MIYERLVRQGALLDILLDQLPVGVAQSVLGVVYRPYDEGAVDHAITWR